MELLSPDGKMSHFYQCSGDPVPPPFPSVVLYYAMWPVFKFIFPMVPMTVVMHKQITYPLCE